VSPVPETVGIYFFFLENKFQFFLEMSLSRPLNVLSTIVLRYLHTKWGQIKYVTFLSLLLSIEVVWKQGAGKNI
jgi:hypothetical protein